MIVNNVLCEEALSYLLYLKTRFFTKRNEMNLYHSTIHNKVEQELKEKFGESNGENVQLK